MSCIFCDIASGSREADIVYKDRFVVAFHDIHPKYKIHILVIPCKHISSAADLSSEDDEIAGRLLRVGAALAKQHGLSQQGFRLVANTGPQAGQTVDHLHVHVLGGEVLREM